MYKVKFLNRKSGVNKFRSPYLTLPDEYEIINEAINVARNCGLGSLVLSNKHVVAKVIKGNQVILYPENPLNKINDVLKPKIEIKKNYEYELRYWR